MQKAIFCMNACEQKSSKKLKNAKLQVNHQCHQCIKRVDIVDENIHFLEQKPLVTWKTSSPQWLPWKPLRELWQLAFKTSKKSKVTWWHSTCCGKLWRAKTFQRSSDQTAVSCYGFSLGFAEHAVALSNLHRGLLQAALRTQRWSLGGFAEPAIRAPLSCSCCRDGWLQSAAVGVKIEHVSKKSQEMIYIYIDMICPKFSWSCFFDSRHPCQRYPLPSSSILHPPLSSSSWSSWSSSSSSSSSSRWPEIVTVFMIIFTEAAFSSSFVRDLLFVNFSHFYLFPSHVDHMVLTILGICFPFSKL